MTSPCHLTILYVYFVNSQFLSYKINSSCSAISFFNNPSLAWLLLLQFCCSLFRLCQLSPLLLLCLFSHQRLLCLLCLRFPHRLWVFLCHLFLLRLLLFFHLLLFLPFLLCLFLRLLFPLLSLHRLLLLFRLLLFFHLLLLPPPRPSLSHIWTESLLFLHLFLLCRILFSPLYAPDSPNCNLPLPCVHKKLFKIKKGDVFFF